MGLYAHLGYDELDLSSVSAVGSPPPSYTMSRRGAAGRQGRHAGAASARRGVENTDDEPGHFVAKLVEIPADLVTWAAGAWRGFLPSALELTGAKGPVVTIPERPQTPGARTWELICDVRYD